MKPCKTCKIEQPDRAFFYTRKGVKLQAGNCLMCRQEAARKQQESALRAIAETRRAIDSAPRVYPKLTAYALGLVSRLPVLRAGESPAVKWEERQEEPQKIAVAVSGRKYVKPVRAAFRDYDAPSPEYWLRRGMQAAWINTAAASRSNR